MSKAEAFEVNFGENKSIGVNVNFSKGDAIQVPVSINSLDAELIATKIADKLELPEIDTTELAKETTLNTVSSKLDNLNVEVDLTQVAKESTLETQGSKIDRILDIVDEKYATQIDEISALL